MVFIDFTSKNSSWRVPFKASVKHFSPSQRKCRLQSHVESFPTKQSLTCSTSSTNKKVTVSQSLWGHERSKEEKDAVHSLSLNYVLYCVAYLLCHYSRICSVDCSVIVNYSIQTTESDSAANVINCCSGVKMKKGITLKNKLNVSDFT